MRIFKEKDSERSKNSKSCEIYNYPISDSDSDVVIAKILGKYPDNGYCINRICKEIIFVIDGHGAIYKRDDEIKFSKGDILIVNKGEEYRWDANCKVCIFSTPTWSSNQYEVILD